MKEILFARKIDDLGRVVIPKEILNKTGWGEGSRFAFKCEKNSIVAIATDDLGSRKLDDLSRLVLPIHLRRELDIKDFDLIDMRFYTDRVVFTKYEG